MKIHWSNLVCVAALLWGCSDPDAGGAAQGVDGAAGSNGSPPASDAAADAHLGAPDAGDAATDVDAGDAATDVDAGDAADAGPEEPAFAWGVNVHPYPKPSAYGFTAADGADRMGEALVYLSATRVRGVPIGETEFLRRLASFGVKQVVLLLSSNAHGKPFDAELLEAALDASLAVAEEVGLQVWVEGLNEWDLFHSKPYNAGVLPAGMGDTEFITHTQHVLYELAHARGVPVLGPSVGHGTEASSLAFFEDVSADVDVVNVHMYFGTEPEQLPLAEVIASHRAFQGEGKPVWVTETGMPEWSVSAEMQADIVTRGIDTFRDSGLVDALFLYELLDGQLPTTYGGVVIYDSAELHFGLFDHYGQAKPAADAVRDL